MYAQIDHTTDAQTYLLDKVTGELREVAGELAVWVARFERMGYTLETVTLDGDECVRALDGDEWVATLQAA